MAMANHAFADSITDGLGMAGDTFYSYTPYVQTLGFVLACIIGIAGAFAIYYAIANNDRNVKKRILAWTTASVTTKSDPYEIGRAHV